MDVKRHNRVGIAFVLEYERGKPKEVRAILGHQGGDWRIGEISSTSGKPNRAANRTAALFAQFELIRNKYADATALNEKKHASLWNFAYKLLSNTGSTNFLCLPCFMPAIASEDSRRQKLENLRESKPRPQHPFFGDWYFAGYEGSKFPLISFTPLCRDTEASEILFVKSDDTQLDTIRERLAKRTLGQSGKRSARRLQAILNAFAQPDKARSKQASAASKARIGRKQKSAVAQVDVRDKYVAWAKTQPTLDPVKFYVDPSVLPYHEAHEYGAAVDGDTEGTSSTRVPAAVCRAPEKLSTVLASGDTVVLLGEPGSGKTSCLRSYFWKMLRGQGPDRVGGDAIPVLFALNHERGNPEQILQRFLARAFPEYSDGTPGSEVAFAVLFDGLDELPPTARRGEFIESALALIRQDHVQHVILSCKTTDWEQLRPHASSAPAVFEIQPFEYGEAMEAEQYLEKRFPEEHKEVLRFLEHDAALHNMTHNPQLLQFSCDLWDADVRNAVSLGKASLIHLWLQTKLVLQDHPDRYWFNEEVAALLANTAYLMHQVDAQEIDRATLVRSGIRIGLVSGRDPFELAKDAGILASAGGPLGNGAIRFIHSTFQDYFASLRIRSDLATSDDAEGYARRHLYRTRWDEPLIMALEEQSDPPGVRALVQCKMAELAPELLLAVLKRCGPLKCQDRSTIVTHLVGILEHSFFAPHIFYCLASIDSHEAFDAACMIIQKLYDYSLQAPDRFMYRAQLAPGYLAPHMLRHLPPNQALPIVRAFLTSSQADLREFASISMARLFPEEDPDLIYNLTASQSREQVSAGLAGLASIQTDRSVEMLEEYATAEAKERSGFARTAMSSLARMRIPSAQKAIQKLLLDQSRAEHEREELALGLCDADLSLLFEFHVHFLSSTSSDTSRRPLVPARSIRQMVRNYRRRHGSLIGNQQLRTEAIQILLSSDDVSVGPLDRIFQLHTLPRTICHQREIESRYQGATLLKGRFRLAYYASRYLPHGVQGHVWDAVCRELALDSLPPAERQEAFVALVHMDAARAVDVAEAFLHKHDKTPLFALLMAVSKGVRLSEDLGDILVDVCIKEVDAEQGDRLLIVTLLSMLKKTPQHRNRIMRLLDRCAFYLDSLPINTFWNDTVLRQHVQDHIDRKAQALSGMRAAYLLAGCGDRHAFAQLAESLPPKWRRLVQCLEPTHAGDPHYASLLDALYELASGLWDSGSPPGLIINSVALAEDSMRDELASALTEDMDNCQRNTIFKLLESVLQTRFQCV